MTSPKAQATVASGFDVRKVREDFPLLRETVRGKPLVYLDSAATSQKPQMVIDEIVDFYVRDNSNVHRGVHRLSERATARYEDARRRLAGFLGAASAREIVFVRGTTEAINLVAHSFVRPRLSQGDEIVITAIEHHSNIVPWQLLREETGALLKVVPCDDQGEVAAETFEAALGPRTRFASLVHISNALGTINPVADMVRLAHARGIPVLVDGAQAASHVPVDVQRLGCDFYAASGHKMCGPTGIGVLYGRAECLEAMGPYQGGGDMIRAVSFEQTTFNDIPYRFEAGTPNIAGAVALGAAVDYLQGLGLEAIATYEDELLAYATMRVQQLPGVRLIGTATHKAGVLSFVLDGIHPHDVGTILDAEAVAVRAGHHCAQPVMERFGVPATVRASVAFYNTREEVDTLLRALGRVGEIFG